MHSFIARGALLLSSLFVAVSYASSEIESKLVLPASFTPPPVFKNTNLLRTIDLTKPYSKEIIAVIAENISGKKQSEYFVPFDKDVVDRVSYVEATDKKGPLGRFEVSKVEFNPERYVENMNYTPKHLTQCGQPYTILPCPPFRTSRARKANHPAACNWNHRRRAACSSRDYAERQAIPQMDRNEIHPQRIRYGEAEDQDQASQQ
jgi:hypothetical protein